MHLFIHFHLHQTMDNRHTEQSYHLARAIEYCVVVAAARVVQCLPAWFPLIVFMGSVRPRFKQQLKERAHSHIALGVQ